MSAAARTASRLSRDSSSCAARSPGCCGLPSASIASCALQTRIRWCPSMSSAWSNPNSMDHDTWLIGVLSIFPFTSLMMSFRSGVSLMAKLPLCLEGYGRGWKSIACRELVREPEAQRQLGTEEGGDLGDLLAAESEHRGDCAARRPPAARPSGSC